jgi:hypothetical protein
MIITTFESESDANKFFEAGDFVVKDRKWFVDRIRIPEREQRYKVRVHWVSHYIPNSVISSILERDGETKAIKVYEDKCGGQGFEHVYALTRTFVFKTKHLENVPYICQWKFKDLYGKAFFTMADRPPYCLRCHNTGHINRECQTPFCTKCSTMGHSINDCAGPTLADRVRGGPLIADKEDYNDPDEQINLPMQTTDYPTRVSQAFSTDHFHGSLVNVGHVDNADAAASLIDLSENVTVDVMAVDGENVTAPVSNTVDGSMPTLNEIVIQMQSTARG